MFKKVSIGMIGALIFSGCVVKECGADCYQQPSVKNQPKQMLEQPKPKKDCPIDNRHYKSCTIRIEATGVGVPPCNGTCSTAQAKVMARRAAILDAYKALTEKLYGIKINGRDTVKNMILQSSTLRAYVEGLIRGATIEDEEFKDGIYKVTMSLRINVAKWNRYLLNNY